LPVAAVQQCAAGVAFDLPVNGLRTGIDFGVVAPLDRLRDKLTEGTEENEY